MTLYEHWQAGARQAYEEMSCLVSAGATADELDLITRQMIAQHEPGASPGDQAREAGYGEMTMDITEKLLDRRDAEAEYEAEL